MAMHTVENVRSTTIPNLGRGLEDFEGCERLFSRTNRFAGMSRWGLSSPHRIRLTNDRTMTKYHRTMLLEKAIEHWNREKYREQGELDPLHHCVAGSLSHFKAASF